jgi:hypothetical protein
MPEPPPPTGSASLPGTASRLDLTGGPAQPLVDLEDDHGPGGRRVDELPILPGHQPDRVQVVWTGSGRVAI